MANDPFTTDNWSKAPYNRRSFQQIQSLFPTARITRGTGPVYEFGEAPKDVSGISYTGLDGSTIESRIADP